MCFFFGYIFYLFIFFSFIFLQHKLLRGKLHNLKLPIIYSTNVFFFCVFFVFEIINEPELFALMYNIVNWRKEERSESEPFTRLDFDKYINCFHYTFAFQNGSCWCLLLFSFLCFSLEKQQQQQQQHKTNKHLKI